MDLIIGVLWYWYYNKYIFSKLCEIFKLSNHCTDLQDAATLDYYTSAVWWGKQQSFTTQQLSGFFTMVHTLFTNVKGKGKTIYTQYKFNARHFFKYFETSIIPIHVRNKAYVIVFVAEKPPMWRNVVWNTKNTNATFIMWKNNVEYERKDEDKLSTNKILHLYLVLVWYIHVYAYDFLKINTCI